MDTYHQEERKEMNSKITLDYEEFEKHILSIQRVFKLQDDMSNLTHNYNNECGDMIEFFFPTLVDNVVELLTKATKDEENGWISYWLYELDCGEKYHDGSVTSADNQIIKLKTIQDLWNVLIEDLKDDF